MKISFILSEACPQVDDVEARRMVVGRVQVGENEWKNIWLFVVDDFASIRIDKFFPESGQYPAKTGEILLERAALKVVNAQIGQTLQIEIPSSPVASLKLVGSVPRSGRSSRVDGRSGIWLYLPSNLCPARWGTRP